MRIHQVSASARTSHILLSVSRCRGFSVIHATSAGSPAASNGSSSVERSNSAVRAISRSLDRPLHSRQHRCDLPLFVDARGKGELDWLEVLFIQLWSRPGIGDPAKVQRLGPKEQKSRIHT